MFSISQLSKQTISAIIEKTTNGKPGHTRRRLAPVCRNAEQQLAAHGFSAEEITQFWRDCKEVAALEMQAED